MNVIALAFTADCTFMLWAGKAQPDLRPWVANAEASLEHVNAGGQIWPVTLGRTHRSCDATWLTSLVSAIIATPRDEITDNSPSAVLSKATLRGLEHVAWAIGLDQSAIINNALLSVSLIGARQVQGLRQAMVQAAQQWPDRYVVARGIMAPADVVSDLASSVGGAALPNRISYVFDLRDGQLPTKINAQRDFKLLSSAALDVKGHSDLTPDMLEAAHRQYLDVYVGRHGVRNPQFTLQFFRDLQIAKAAEFIGLARDGRLVAFAALRDHAEFYSVPLIGYDMAAPQRHGLYRQIFALALRTAAQRKALINFGAGAPRYKTLRGAEPDVEHMVIIPPRSTVTGRLVAAVLRIAQKSLFKVVPEMIAAHGG
jgi:hypothetical protein